ncbi:kinesin family protein [Aspergillus affinis]|uniref:kinesin family protein n=1 Tax=Aspergillus affinis TaxID=1070780 RepID=UPI0022FE2060|nr:kinesin family protein [Aspergillus affinis]KAI9038881.1 kinesin family protein [Aspergillus affinis]
MDPQSALEPVSVSSASHKNVINDILKRLDRLESHVLPDKDSDERDDASSTASLADSVMIEPITSHPGNPCPPISPRPAFGILDRLKEGKVKSQLSSILFQLRYTKFGLFEDEQFANALQASLEDLESSETQNEGYMPYPRPFVTKEMARKWLNLFFETHQFGAFQLALPKDFIMTIPDLLEIRHVQLDNLSLIIYYNVVFQGMLLDHDNIEDRNSFVQYFYQTCMDMVEGWLDKVENTATDLYATFLMYSMSVEAFNSDLAWEIFGKSCTIARALGYFVVDVGAQDPNDQQMGFNQAADAENETEKNRKRFEFWHLLRTDCIFRLNFGKPALITQGSWAVNFPDPSIDGNVDETPRFVQIHFLASMRLTFVLLKYLDLMNTETLQDTVQYNEALENLVAEAKSIMTGWRVEDLLNDTTNQIDLWVCVDILFSGYKLLIILYQSKKSDQSTSHEIVDIARTSLTTMQSLVHSAPKMYWGTRVLARWRPLSSDEAGQQEIEREYTHRDSHTSSLSIAALLQPQSVPSRDRSWQSGPSFTEIFETDDNNKTVFDAVVAPILPRVLEGQSCNFFAYGHSGSGKSHTIIGYDYEHPDEFGLCLAAARSLHEIFEKINAADTTATQLGLGIRMVRPILTKACWNFEDLRRGLRVGLKLRATGTSSIHDQSSRTHAVLELEIVTRSLLEAHDAVVERQSELVPVGKRATDVYIEEHMRALMQDADGKYIPNPDHQLNQEAIDAAETEKMEFEARVKKAEDYEDEVFKTTARRHVCLGGKLVFVDLAGSEYYDNKNSLGQKQTSQEKQEGR